MAGCGRVCGAQEGSSDAGAGSVSVDRARNERQLDLVRAFEIVAAKWPRALALEIAGPEGDEDEFARLISYSVERGLAGRVRVVGPVPASRTAAFLDRPAIFAFPSRFQEAFGSS